MAQYRYRHNITDSSGTNVSGVSSLEPPPEVVELVGENQKADMIWKGWLENLYEYIGALTHKTNDVFISPSSINVNIGGTPVGDVTDVQTLDHATVYNLPEVNGGFDVDFVFENVESFTGLVSYIQYVGSTNHLVQMDIHDYVAAASDQYVQIPHNTTLFQYRTIRFPALSQYVNSSNQATVSIIHTTTPGNTNHDLFVGYIALIGKTT